MGFMDAVGYVGDTIAKPGRAVRGALAGRLSELANLVPFSDTMGLTDPSQQVRGRDLLNQLGATQADDDGWGAMLGGLGVDIATDPLTYLGGAALRAGSKAMGFGAGGVALPPELAATRAAEAAAGQFPLVDEIGKLVNPADEITRGAASPWSPATPPGGIDLGPLAPMDVPAFPRAAPPIDARVPPPIDELFQPSPFNTHYGSDYSAPRMIGDYLEPWGQSLANDALLDGDPATAFGVALGSWGKQIDDLDRLSPAARAQLVGDGAASAGDRNWQQLIHARRGDLQATQRMAAAGVFPEDLARQAAEQEARLFQHASWGTPRSRAGQLFDDSMAGLYTPDEVTGMIRGGDLSFLPIDEPAMRAAATRAQERLARSQIEEYLTEFLGAYPTPAGINAAVGTHPGTYLARHVGDLIDPKYWARQQNIAPDIADAVLRSPPGTREGDLLAALRQALAREAELGG